MASVSVTSTVEQRLQRFLHAFGHDLYEEGINPFLDHLYFLLPIARLLDADLFFRSFYVFSHHAVIDVQSVPPGKIAKKVLSIFAPTTEEFRITLFQADAKDKRLPLTREYCRGAEETLLRLKQIITGLPDGMTDEGDRLSDTEI